jgi:hypothetical protein
MYNGSWLELETLWAGGEDGGGVVVFCMEAIPWLIMKTLTKQIEMYYLQLLFLLLLFVYQRKKKRK